MPDEPIWQHSIRQLLARALTRLKPRVTMANFKIEKNAARQAA
ncbi:MAG: hypothetical protein QW482_03435 [Thermoproteota archaeon]